MRVPARRLLAGMIASTSVIGAALVASGVTSATATPTSATTPRPEPAPAVPAPAAAPTPVGAVVEPAALPAEYAEYTAAAATCPGLDPLVLVAIHQVETGRDRTGRQSTAGAVGPMQFLPDTWKAYGVDADGDGRATAFELEDALAGATRLLCANGIANPATHASAIWNYNHSWSYVREVLADVYDLQRAQSTSSRSSGNTRPTLVNK